MQTRGLCAKSGQLTADFYGQKTAVRAVFGDFADVSRWCSRQTCGPTPDDPLDPGHWAVTGVGDPDFFFRCLNYLRDHRSRSQREKYLGQDGLAHIKWALRVKTRC